MSPYLKLQTRTKPVPRQVSTDSFSPRPTQEIANSPILRPSVVNPAPPEADAPPNHGPTDDSTHGRFGASRIPSASPGAGGKLHYATPELIVQ